MILVIDNYDSFTYNLVQQIEALGEECEVFANDRIFLDEIAAKKPSKIIISPGPGNTDNAGVSNQVIKRFYKSIPMLGVCLGHQCIGVAFGAKLTHAKSVMHGKISTINHNNDDLFIGTSQEIIAARYHSLALEDVKSPLQIIAAADDGTIMAVRHQNFPVWGVQFHPESFLTKDGEQIVRNFVSCK